jgi:Fe2+ or Zn2+ uptake regulation protein
VDMHKVLSVVPQSIPDSHDLAEARLAWAVARCLEAGLRVTPARERILRYIARHRVPVSWEMLTESAELRGLCDPATIARTLGLFKEADLVRQIILPARERYFLLNSPGEHAGLLICRRCRTATEFKLEAPVLRRMERLAQAERFSWARSEVVVYGLCFACQTLKAKEPMPNKLRVN